MTYQTTPSRLMKKRIPVKRIARRRVMMTMKVRFLVLQLVFIARLFLEKTRGIAIALASSSSAASSCKNYFVISLLLLKKLGMCSLSILSRETIQNAFFQNFAPFFDLDFLSSIKHPMAKRLHHMQCSCLTPFS